MFGPSSRKPTRPRCPEVVVLAKSHEKSRQSRACSSIAAATPSPFLLQWQCRIALDLLRALDFAFSVKLGKLLVGGSAGADGGAKLVKLRADFVKLLAQAGGLGGMAVGHLAQVVGDIIDVLVATGVAVLMYGTLVWAAKRYPGPVSVPLFVLSGLLG